MGLLLVIMLVLSGCTRSGDPVGNSDASSREQTPVVEPTGTSPPGAIGEHEAAQDEGAGPDLYRVDPATGGIELILSSTTEELREPERSPDGSRLVYQSEAPVGIPQIFVLEDGRSRQLTHLLGGAFEPAWSTDGSQIAFAAGSYRGRGQRRDTDIFVMDADGSHIRRVAGTARNDGHPDWSADGSRIAFHSRNHSGIPRGVIWVVSVHDGELTRLTRGNGADPAWSPDGRRIAYSRLPGSGINGRMPFAPLWVMRAVGTGKRALHRWRRRWGVCEFDPSWSPDGSSIAFIDRGSGSSRIGIIDVRTRESTYLATPHSVADLSWGSEGLIASMGDALDPPPVRGQCAGPQ